MVNSSFIKNLTKHETFDMNQHSLSWINHETLTLVLPCALDKREGAVQTV
jgi:hypothetical protein